MRLILMFAVMLASGAFLAACEPPEDAGEAPAQMEQMDQQQQGSDNY